MIANDLYPSKLVDHLESTRIGGTGKKPNQVPFTPDKVTKHIFLPWKDLQEDKLKAVRQIKTVQQKREYLCECLKLDTVVYPCQNTDTEEGRHNATRKEIFLDLVLSTLAFCYREKFTLIKISTLISIVRAVHTAACELPGPPMKLDKAYSMFEDLVLKHSVERPPFSIAVFSFTDTKSINAHFVNTYFRHLKMYQYVFGAINELHLQPTSSIAFAVGPQVFTSLDTAEKMTDLNEPTVSTSATPDIDAAAPADGSASATPAPVEEGQEEGTEDSSNPTPVPQMEVAVPKLPRLETVLKSQEDQDMFEKALTYELVKIQKELNEKLQEQQASFETKLSELENAAPPASARGGGKAKKK